MDRCLILIPLKAIFITLYIILETQTKKGKINLKWKKMTKLIFFILAFIFGYPLEKIIITKLCFSREANHGFFAASSLLIPSSLFFVSETMFFIEKNSIWVIFVVSMSFFKMLMLSFTFLNPWKISYNNCLKVIVYWLYHLHHFSVCFH